MTNAEHVARWRKRHAAEIAQRTPKQRPATMQDLIQALPTADDWDRWLGRKPWDDDEVGSAGN